MNYEEFLCYVQESISKRMEPNSKVRMHKVIKNNDIELNGLSIMREEESMSPTIYLNDYYKSYYEGKDPKDIIDEILDLYDAHKDEIPFDIEAFKSYDQIKERIAYKLINYETNTKLLEDVPYQRILDLAIVFYVVISNDSIGAATVLIRHEHMDLWNITENQLYEEAKKNTPLLFKEQLQDIEDVIREFLSEEYPYKDTSDDFEDLLDEASEKTTMYVLTNEERINGAAAILYDNLLSTFADEIEQNLYILPSSIHEVILVPATREVTQIELEKMVLEVNTNEVSEGERLSNHVYFFDRVQKVLCM
ncbi:MAG: hypothetical protein GX913_03260 [Clostridiales bacterium]|nr:hypothetical protein [Clostridiales bacterium]